MEDKEKRACSIDVKITAYISDSLLWVWSLHLDPRAKARACILYNNDTDRGVIGNTPPKIKTVSQIRM